MLRLLYTDITRTTGISRREAEKNAGVRLLEAYLGYSAEICHHPDGAPYVGDNHPELHISISHSATTCLLAVSDTPVGVDIESPRQQLAGVASKFLTPAESEALASGPTDRNIDTLLHYWTAKEAAFKLLRLPGLTVSTIEVSPDLSSASAADGTTCRITFIPLGEQLIAVASHECGIEYSLDYIH